MSVAKIGGLEEIFECIDDEDIFNTTTSLTSMAVEGNAWNEEEEGASFY